jgi:hypothetical protein
VGSRGRVHLARLVPTNALVFTEFQWMTLHWTYSRLFGQLATRDVFRVLNGTPDYRKLIALPYGPSVLRVGSLVAALAANHECVVDLPAATSYHEVLQTPR